MNRSRAAVLVLPALLLAACGQAAQPAGAAKQAITVSESPAVRGSVATLFRYSASTAPRWSVTVQPQTSGPVVDLRIQQGQRVNQGEVLAVLDHRALDDQAASAQANLDSAQAKLNSLLRGARAEDVAAAQAQAGAAQAGVSQAQANLESAKQRLAQAQAGGRAESVAQSRAKLDADQAVLDKLLNGPTSQDVTNAKLTVEQAKDKLWADQTTYDAQVGRGQMTKEQRESALSVDQTAIDQAKTSLAKLVAAARSEDVAQAQAAVNADKQALEVAKQPNRPEDIAQLQQSVVAAQAQVSQAQQQAAASAASAAKAASPYTGDDVAQGQAAVGVAQASLQSAQTQLSYATVVAPAAGIISDVPVAVGSQVGPSTPIATLISPDLEVDASVEETQVGLFKEGQPASIALAGGTTAVDGKVLLVAPAADTRTRKFLVKVTPASPDSPLRAGMSANVSIQTGQQEDALLVPKDAVLQRNGQQIVFADENGRAKLHQVQTAIGSDTQVRITSGLDDGAEVILPGSIDLADGDLVVPASAVPGPATESAS